MPLAEGDLGEPTLRRLGLPVIIEAPAHGSSVLIDSARMGSAGSHGTEPALGHLCLTSMIRAPTDHSAVGPQSARMAISSRDVIKRPVGRIESPVAITTPALDGTVVVQPADVSDS